MSSHAGTFGALLLSGLVGSLGHCIGMCGPLVLMVGLQMERKGLAAIPQFLLYHASRIIVYGVMGAIVGGLGALLGQEGGRGTLGGGVSLALGLGVILFGLSYLGWLPLSRSGGNGSWLGRLTNRVFRGQGFARVPLMGALNGLLPCGLVYSALLVCAGTGGILPGAVGMLIFGLGTVPALLAVGLGAGFLRARLRQTLLRAAGVVIMLVGLQLALRGLAAFGWIPHWKIGGLMIW